LVLIDGVDFTGAKIKDTVFDRVDFTGE